MSNKEKYFTSNKQLSLFPIITLILIFITMNLSIAQKIVLLPPTSHGEYLNGTKYKGNTITFTGSRSHDNDSYVGEFTPEWKWDFDYGGNFVPDVTTPNATVTHKYTMAGVYRVGVQYYDDDGQAGNIYTFEITIAGHNRYYYVKDHLGSIRVTIDDQGEAASAQDYYAYGEIIADRSYNNSSPNEKYKFTEKERDTETNYDYFGARYYDSEIGRWLAVDPMSAMRPGLSPYNYCQNSPFNRIDPDGQLDVSRIKNDFPRSAELLLTLDRRVTQKMLDAFKEYGQASEKLVFEALTPNKGPLIVAEDLNVYGQYDELNRPNDLQVDYWALALYEEGIVSSKLVEAVVLHELTHYFDWQYDQKRYPDYYDAGIAFEIWVYGKTQDEWNCKKRKYRMGESSEISKKYKHKLWKLDYHKSENRKPDTIKNGTMYYDPD